MTSGTVPRQRWLGALIAICVIAIVAVPGVRALRSADPVVNGSTMSEWVRTLTERWTSAHGTYRYPPGVRQALGAEREAAIAHLIAAIADRPRPSDALRNKVSKRLPPSLARIVRPDRPRLRWAGVMALSDLAHKQPDARIGRVFRQCMRDPDPVVRKVAAYELGPWIFPNNPEVAAILLRDALNDPVSHVRRDACRRIAMADREKYPEYASYLRGLLNDIAKLSAKDSSREVRECARGAYRTLGGGDLALAGHEATPQ